MQGKRLSYMYGKTSVPGYLRDRVPVRGIENYPTDSKLQEDTRAIELKLQEDLEKLRKERHTIDGKATLTIKTVGKIALTGLLLAGGIVPLLIGGLPLLGLTVIPFLLALVPAAFAVKDFADAVKEHQVKNNKIKNRTLGAEKEIIELHDKYKEDVAPKVVDKTVQTAATQAVEIQTRPRTVSEAVNQVPSPPPSLPPSPRLSPRPSMTQQNLTPLDRVVRSSPIARAGSYSPVPPFAYDFRYVQPSAPPGGFSFGYGMQGASPRGSEVPQDSKAPASSGGDVLPRVAVFSVPKMPEAGSEFVAGSRGARTSEGAARHPQGATGSGASGSGVGSYVPSSASQLPTAPLSQHAVAGATQSATLPEKDLTAYTQVASLPDLSKLRGGGSSASLGGQAGKGLTAARRGRISVGDMGDVPATPTAAASARASLADLGIHGNSGSLEQILAPPRIMVPPDSQEFWGAAHAGQSLGRPPMPLGPRISDQSPLGPGNRRSSDHLPPMPRSRRSSDQLPMTDVLGRSPGGAAGTPVPAGSTFSLPSVRSSSTALPLSAVERVANAAPPASDEGVHPSGYFFGPVGSPLLHQSVPESPRSPMPELRLERGVGAHTDAVLSSAGRTSGMSRATLGLEHGVGVHTDAVLPPAGPTRTMTRATVGLERVVGTHTDAVLSSTGGNSGRAWFV